MKREDFNIDGIPEGYRVYDVDLTPSGRPVAVLGHETDKTRPVFVRWHGADVPLPDDALWWNDHLKQLLLAPIVRAAGEDRLVVVTAYVNAHFDSTGRVEHEFDIGSADEVLASEQWIVAHYSDQAMTSPGGPEAQYEGIAIFNMKGNLQWGYQSSGVQPKLDVFFHCAAWISPDEIVVFRDVEYGAFDITCSAIRLDLRERRPQIWRPPLPIATPAAVTTVGERVILHGAGTDAEGRQFLESFASGKMQRELQERGLAEAISKQLVEYSANDPKLQQMLGSSLKPDDIVEWRPGESTWRVIGEWPARQLRGLPGGRFIAAQPDGYTILSFD